MVAGRCNCCGSLEHLWSECPSRDKTCDLCGRVGHLRIKCTYVDGGKGGKGAADAMDMTSANNANSMMR